MEQKPKTKEEIWEIKDKLKRIWVKYRDDLTLREIFDDHMNEYFTTSGSENFRGVEWLTLVSLSSKWKREIEKKTKAEEAKEVEGLTPEQIQEGNRTKMIHILRAVLNQYERNPNKLKNISLSDIKGLYKIIQSLEEIKKKTEIERGKLKLDTVKALLPYNRLSPEKVQEVKQKLLGSFDMIEKFKKGELVVAKIEEPDEKDLE